MATVCIDTCPLAVNAAGLLTVNWPTMGEDNLCQTTTAYSGDGGSGPTDWSGMRNIVMAWTNPTCRTHRVTASFTVPWVRMRVGRGNNWFVRGDLRGSIGVAPPTETASSPDLMWVAGWSTLNADGTDNDNTAPGFTQRVFIVQPGAVLNIHARLMFRVDGFTVRPSNLLETGVPRVMLSMRPAKTTGGSGAVC